MARGPFNNTQLGQINEIYASLDQPHKGKENPISELRRRANVFCESGQEDQCIKEAITSLLFREDILTPFHVLKQSPFTRVLTQLEIMQSKWQKFYEDGLKKGPPQGRGKNT